MNFKELLLKLLPPPKKEQISPILNENNIFLYKTIEIFIYLSKFLKKLLVTKTFIHSFNSLQQYTFVKLKVNLLFKNYCFLFFVLFVFAFFVFFVHFFFVSQQNLFLNPGRELKIYLNPNLATFYK